MIILSTEFLFVEEVLQSLKGRYNGDKLINLCFLSVFDGLQQRNSSLVFADIPQLLKNVESNLITRFVGPNAYIRFHEKNLNSWYADKSLPENVFSEEELKKFIPIIQQAQQENRTVSIFFYNHSQASGALAASKLTSLAKLSD